MTKPSRHQTRVASIMIAELQTSGLKQAECARLLGRHPQYVTDILTGRKKMDAFLALQLERIFDRPAIDFLAAELQDQLALAPVQAHLRSIDAAVRGRQLS